MQNQYRCGLCCHVYEKGLTDEEAWQQTQDYWPGVSQEDCVVVCDDCWQKIRPERNENMKQHKKRRRKTRGYRDEQ